MRCYDLHRCRLQPGRLGLSEIPVPYGPWLLCDTREHNLGLAGWGIARGGSSLVWGILDGTTSPGALQKGTFECLWLTRPHFSQLCLCRVARIIWIAGWVLSKPPAEFLFHGVTAVWGGGHGSLIKGDGSPLACSAMSLLSQNSRAGEAPSPARGQQTGSWPTASSVTLSLSKPPRPAYP